MFSCLFMHEFQKKKLFLYFLTNFLRFLFFFYKNFAVGNLPQYANVRSCNCCPYGYHIDLDFVRYCETLANAKPSEEELQRRSRRRSRKSMEFMLGLDSIFDQWDANERQQTLTEVSCGLRFIVVRFKTLKLFIQV